MWHSAGERHKQSSGYRKQLQHDRSRCEECNTPVVVIMLIRDHIQDGKSRKRMAGPACVHGIIYNAMCCNTKGDGIIAAKGKVCNTTCRFGDGLRSSPNCNLLAESLQEYLSGCGGYT
jgi:hypothetical protein